MGREDARLASVTERNRIAREMHDIVAHSLTVMIALSDGAAVVVKRNPDAGGGGPGELSRTGRTALADMRRVLGVLRDDAGPAQAPREPLAAGDSLGKLLEGFRAAGLPLHYTLTGPSLPDDAAFRLTVYRIVQESLTNVLRYGRPWAGWMWPLIRDGATVTIDVVDDGRGSVDSGGSAAAPASRDPAGRWAPARASPACASGPRSTPAPCSGRSADRGWRVHAVLPWNGKTTKARAHESRGTDG